MRRKGSGGKRRGERKEGRGKMEERKREKGNKGRGRKKERRRKRGGGMKDPAVNKQKACGWDNHHETSKTWAE